MNKYNIKSSYGGFYLSVEIEDFVDVHRTFQSAFASSFLQQIVFDFVNAFQLDTARTENKVYFLNKIKFFFVFLENIIWIQKEILFDLYFNCKERLKIKLKDTVGKVFFEVVEIPSRKLAMVKREEVVALEIFQLRLICLEWSETKYSTKEFILSLVLFATKLLNGTMLKSFG